MKRTLILLLKLAVAGALIYWLISSDRLDFAALRRVRDGWPWLLAAQVPFALVLVLAALRWLLLLRAQGMTYRFRDVYSIHLIGWLFNQLMFGAAGGDVVRAYMVARDYPDFRSAAILSVVADRLIGLFVLALVALVSLLIALLGNDSALGGGETTQAGGQEYLTFLAWVLVTCLGGGVVFLVLFFSGAVTANPRFARLVERLPLRPVIEKFLAVANRYREHSRTVFCALGITVFIHLGVIATNVLLLHALFRDPVGWGSLFFVIPVAHFLMAIPLNPPGAVGTGEAIYEELFSWVGLQAGALTSLLQRFTALVWAGVGLVLYLARRRRVGKALDDARRAEETADDPTVETPLVDEGSRAS